MRTQVRVASPCSADWNKMVGDDRVRHCDSCNLDVYNFAALTDLEAERLIANRQDRLCARLYRRADGTVITQNCPVGFRARVRKVSRIAGAALSAAMSVTFAGAQISSQNQPSSIQMEKGKAAIALHVLNQSGEAVEGAIVVLRSKNYRGEFTGKTDAQGNIRLSALAAGEYELSVSSPGFATFSNPVFVDQHGTLKVNAELRVVAVIGEVVPVPRRNNIFLRFYHKVL
ncbi:MAG TPA: carboxypeptidase-like regulatory domain-containing protein [Terriglobales bacterium]|jgi:hypothetical protein